MRLLCGLEDIPVDFTLGHYEHYDWKVLEVKFDQNSWLGFCWLIGQRP